MKIRHQPYPDCRCLCYGCRFTCDAHWPWHDRIWRAIRHPGETKPIGTRGEGRREAREADE